MNSLPDKEKAKAALAQLNEFSTTIGQRDPQDGSNFDHYLHAARSLIEGSNQNGSAPTALDALIYLASKKEVTKLLPDNSPQFTLVDEYIRANHSTFIGQAMSMASQIGSQTRLRRSGRQHITTP